MHWFLWLLAGLALGAALTATTVWAFRCWGMLDFPSRYGLTRAPIPYPAGVAYALGAVGLLLIDPQFWRLLVPMAPLAVVSFMDDRHPLPAWFRLAVQVGCAALLWQFGVRIDFLGHPFDNTNIEIMPTLSLALGIIWVVLLANAVNFFDGLSGLVPSVAGVGFACLGVLGLTRPELLFDPAHAPVTLAAWYSAGLAAGGAWWFLRKKAILGDAGAQTLGFYLAGLSIFAGAKIATTLLVLGVPVIDALLTVARRVWTGQSPFAGDQNHLHHRLRNQFSEATAVTVIVLLSASFGVLAVLTSGIWQLAGLGAMVLLVVALWGRIR